MGIHIDLREKLANDTKDLDAFQSVISELKNRVEVRIQFSNFRINYLHLQKIFNKNWKMKLILKVQ
jgi:outer membrane lipoprotein-sorting protein